MADYKSNWRPMPKSGTRAYQERVLGEAANYREQAAQSLRISAAMLAKARELIEQTRKTLRQNEAVAEEEHQAESVTAKAKSGIPYSVATDTGDNLALNRQLQAEQQALLEKNRELRQSIKMKLQRHRDALDGTHKRKR